MQTLLSNSKQISAKASCLFNAGQIFCEKISNHQKLSTDYIKKIMTNCCDGSDVNGVWQWKDAYEAIEVALVLQLKRQSTISVAELEQIEQLYPTHTKRTLKSIELQQFSTPITIGYLTKIAANTGKNDIVLEPSAGTGMLAAYQQNCNKLILNEIDGIRAEILKQLFPAATISSHNAEQINDRLDLKLKPTVIVMNPPFSAYLNHQAKNSAVAIAHLTSAFKRLQPQGRLIAITQESIRPNNSRYIKQFLRIQQEGRVIFSCGIEGSAYRKQGTRIKTRLTVIDKVPAIDPAQFCSVLPTLAFKEIFKQLPQLVPAKNHETTA